MRKTGEIRPEWREALKEHDAAIKQYSPFIATMALTPSQNHDPISYEDLKAAHDRLKASEKSLNRIMEKFYEAFRREQSIT